MPGGRHRTAEQAAHTETTTTQPGGRGGVLASRASPEHPRRGRAVKTQCRHSEGRHSRQGRRYRRYVLRAMLSAAAFRTDLWNRRSLAPLCGRRLFCQLWARRGSSEPSWVEPPWRLPSAPRSRARTCASSRRSGSRLRVRRSRKGLVHAFVRIPQPELAHAGRVEHECAIREGTAPMSGGMAATASSSRTRAWPSTPRREPVEEVDCRRRTIRQESVSAGATTATDSMPRRCAHFMATTATRNSASSRAAESSAASTRSACQPARRLRARFHVPSPRTVRDGAVELAIEGSGDEQRSTLAATTWRPLATRPPAA